MPDPTFWTCKACQSKNPGRRIYCRICDAHCVTGAPRPKGKG